MYFSIAPSGARADLLKFGMRGGCAAVPHLAVCLSFVLFFLVPGIAGSP